MVEPVAFSFNNQTASTNYFQQKDTSEESDIQCRALAEFSRMVEQLRAIGIRVLVVKDRAEPHTPDSIFPNNWVTFHANGRVVLYPMYAENRRNERRADILQFVADSGFPVLDIVDYTAVEKKNLFLEGTGSMVLDHVNRMAYAALSDRTDKTFFLQLCSDFNYRAICFSAYQTVEGNRLPVYHTNVMMCIADSYAVVCLDCIDDVIECKLVFDSLKATGKKIITISEEQMLHFAGNLLQVENRDGKRFLVLSRSAYDSLTDIQINSLSVFNELIIVEIPTIEKLGGGSARCMMAEVF